MLNRLISDNLSKIRYFFILNYDKTNFDFVLEFQVNDRK